MLLTKEQYARAKDLYDKKVAPSPLLSELAAWAGENFRVTVIDYICDIRSDGHLRLKLVLWDYVEEKLLRNGCNYDAQIQKLFAEKFAEISCKYQVHTEYQKPEKVFVCYDTLKDEIRGDVLQKAKEEFGQLAGGEIWKVKVNRENITIFYKTDAQIEENEKNGTSEALKQKCIDIIKKYDDYGLWENGIFCEFCSHQTFLEKYKGNWQFYYQR